MRHNAMNEMCNGIELEGEFETRMGVSLEKAMAVLRSIQSLMSEMARQA